MTTPISQLLICNWALSHIGKPQVSALSGGSGAVVECNRSYEVARLEALRANEWNFSTGWVEGTQLEIDAKPPWTYVYEYPSTAIHFFRIIPDVGEREVACEVGDRMDEDGKVIYTDRDDAYFVIARDKEDPALFDWDFAIAMSWLLASKIAMPLTKSKKLAAECMKEYQMKVSEAGAKNRNEGSPDNDRLASYHEVR